MFRAILIPLILVAVVGCSGGSKFKSYGGPEVTQIYVSKEDRKMYLMHDKEVLKTYEIDLGFSPDGHKYARGDGRTPEGGYWIDRRNPRSQYHLSLGISYPNANDTALAEAAGVSPGGDIFIHGKSQLRGNGQDWTAGCIAVTDKEMEEIYAMVSTGTFIYIAP